MKNQVERILANKDAVPQPGGYIGRPPQYGQDHNGFFVKISKGIPFIKVGK